jgi:hypothetical protein
MLNQSGMSEVLNLQAQDNSATIKAVFIEARSSVSASDPLPLLGPIDRNCWAAIGADGSLLLPTSTDARDFCDNLRKLARYRFGLGLRNVDHTNVLWQGSSGVLLNLQLMRRRSECDGWTLADPARDGFPKFHENDHISCIIQNNSSVDVYPYILEFAEDGSVAQRYPSPGGEELLLAKHSTSPVAVMCLKLSNVSSFQLAGGSPPATGVTEVLKLFAATKPVDLSLLTQSRLVARHGSHSLSSVLRIGEPYPDREVLAWETVEAPFVLVPTTNFKENYPS